MRIGERLRAAWLFLIKHTLNHLTGALARGAHGPFAIVRHVGRKSGAVYETPIIVQPIDHGFVIELTYGPTVNWYRNVVAAGGCTIIRHRIEYTVTALEPLDSAVALDAYPAPERWLLRRMRREEFVRFVVG